MSAPVTRRRSREGGRGAGSLTYRRSMRSTTQGQSRIRLEWGAAGAGHIVAARGVAVVVDVLSFTTTLTIAVERGAEVYPYEWGGDSAADFAQARDARHAVGRFEAQRTGALTTVSLSPARMLQVSGLERLVLPSPNGSTISAQLRDSGATVVGACLRNAAAVGEQVADHMRDNPGCVLALVAAGERWDDGSLRPAVEDLWGCGAVLAGIRASASELLADASPEALLGLAGYDALGDDLLTCMLSTTSGQELVQDGFRSDVIEACRENVSPVVPVLRGERFVAAETSSPLFEGR